LIQILFLSQVDFRVSKGLQNLPYKFCSVKIFKPSSEFKSRVEFKFPWSSILCLNPNYPWFGVQNPGTNVQILIFREVQTSVCNSKSIQIAAKIFKKELKPFSKSMSQFGPAGPFGLASSSFWPRLPTNPSPLPSPKTI
jgi:hypothetical protein